MLRFDADTARLLEIAYQGADVTRRRRASLEGLRPEPKDHIADIGCGNGLLPLELARAVGDGGQVTGIDPSADMRALAEERYAAFPNVAVVDGSAGSLPFGDGAVDKAVSLQVFEYLADIPAALAEARRVLRPDGRVVIGAMHWDTLAWHGDDAARMKRMPDAALDIIIEQCRRSPSAKSKIFVEFLGGAFGEVPREATVFDHRQARHNLLIIGAWDDQAMDQANRSWARETWQAMQTHASEGYI